MLIHLHIPKTGGTSVRHLLATNYGSTFYGLLPVPQTDSFWSLAAKDQQKIKCLSGHLAYGMAPFALAPFVYLVVLRDPIERLLSLYHYRWIKDAVKRTEAERQQTLEDFLASTTWACNDNDQVRHLAGLACHGSAERQGTRSVTQKDLDLAVHNLQNCQYVGVTEHLQADIDRFAVSLGWQEHYLGHALRVAQRLRAADLDRRLREQIYQSQQYDYQLYRCALERHKELCAK